MSNTFIWFALWINLFFSVYALVKELICSSVFQPFPYIVRSEDFLYTSWHMSDEKHPVLISSPSAAEACLKPIYSTMRILMSCLICLTTPKGGYFKVLEDTQTNLKSNLSVKPSGPSCVTFKASLGSSHRKMPPRDVGSAQTLARHPLTQGQHLLRDDADTFLPVGWDGEVLIIMRMLRLGTEATHLENRCIRVAGD